MTSAEELSASIPSFQKFLRDDGNRDDENSVPQYIYDKVELLKTIFVEENKTWWTWFWEELERSSQETQFQKAKIVADPTYPDQGLVLTAFEADPHNEQVTVGELEKEQVNLAVLAMLYYLELFNHPERVQELFKQSEQPFQEPKKKFHPEFFRARILKESITINDLALSVQGSDKPRQSRTERFQEGPFINYGRHPEKTGPLPALLQRLRDFLKGDWKFSTEHHENVGRMQARSLITGGANPDVFGTARAISLLAQFHSLSCLPRDGVFSDVKRQVALAKKIFEWNERSPVLYGRPEEEKKKLLEYFNHNVVGVLEASNGNSVSRAEKLYEVGVRSFRIYSPEPGSGGLEVLRNLRKYEKEQDWEPIEIFVGQVVDVQQAIHLEQAGANGIYIGIGGGGRCITGIVGNLTIDWPQLLWDLRGKIHIPVFVEGGASDHIGVSLTLGASGLGATGKLTGNIENPGGYRVFYDENGDPFVYYGGEASDRMREMGGRNDPFNRKAFTEGETRREYIFGDKREVPTMGQTLLGLHEGIIGAMVFQNARNLHDKAVKTLRVESRSGGVMKNTH